MISINFASGNYRRAVRIVQALAAGSVILALAAALMIVKAVSLRADIAAMQKKLQEAEAADQLVKPALMERERLVKDLNAMSALMDARRFSWTRLLSSIESVVPVGVALQKVQYNPHDHSLVLDGTAQSPESLRGLVVGLEKSPSFKDPFLKHQTLEKGSISFNVVAVYHERKDAVEVQRKE
jgi:Tfp pilus assembly protein PilN